MRGTRRFKVKGKLAQDTLVCSRSLAIKKKLLIN
jgi:hypothetical protein